MNTAITVPLQMPLTAEHDGREVARVTSTDAAMAVNRLWGFQLLWKVPAWCNPPYDDDLTLAAVFAFPKARGW